MTNKEKALIVAQIVDVKNVESAFVRNLVTVNVIRTQYPTLSGLDFAEVFEEAEKVLDIWYK